MLTFDGVWHFGEVLSSRMNPGFHCTGQITDKRVWRRVGERFADVNVVKIAKTLKLSCSTVAKTIYSVLTGQVTLRTGLAMVDQRSWVHVLSVKSRGCVWEKDVWVLPALLQRLKRGGESACQCSDHKPYTASNWSAWLSSQKEASSKDDAQESPQTVCWRQAD